MSLEQIGSANETLGPSILSASADPNHQDRSLFAATSKLRFRPQSRQCNVHQVTLTSEICPRSCADKSLIV